MGDRLLSWVPSLGPPLWGTGAARRMYTARSVTNVSLRKKMGAYLLLTCIALPFFGVISLFFIQETRRALDVALGFSLLTFLSSVGL